VSASDSQLLAYDFYHFWAAGQVARAGGNPYDVTTLKPLMAGIGWPETEQVFGFLHPFWTVWFFAGISLLPFSVAAVAWCALIVAMTVFCVRTLLNPSIRHRLGFVGASPLIFCATALFPPFMSSLVHGQSNVIPLLGIVGWIAAFHRGSPSVAGAVLSLTTFKPQLFLPLYTFVFASEMYRKDLRGIIGFAGGIIAQAAVSLAINNNILSHWYAAVVRTSESTMNLPTPTLSRMVSSWTGDPRWALYLVGAGSCFAVAAALRQPRDLMRGFFLFLPISALAAPYVWGHAFLPLLPVYLLLVGELAERSARGVLYFCALFALFGICEIVRPHLFGPTMVCLPAILLAFMICRVRGGCERL
jgi:Glycosyltransferase family 87